MTAPAADTTPRNRRPRLIALTVVGALLIVVVFAAIWIGVRGLAAKAALESAQASISALRSADGLDGVTDTIESIADDTADARTLTSDPIWRAAELVPVAGGNLRATRELAAATDRISTEILTPVADTAASLGDALAPRDGRIDVEALSAATALVADSVGVLADIRSDVDTIDVDGTIGAISGARSQLLTAIDGAEPLLAQASSAAAVLPGMLGADGPRNYLLMFANNAEARPLAGNPASLSIVTVDNGAISITAQASSRDFPRGGNPPLQLAPEILQAYYELFPRYVMDSPTRPDFPTMAQLGQAYWQQQFGLRVDGVLTIDPIALGYLLEGADPVALPDGYELTSANAAQLLLSDIYSIYPASNDRDPEEAQQNVFFQAAAQGAFTALTGGGVAPEELLRGAAKAIDEGRLMVWSANADEEAVIAQTPVSGVLPIDNVDATAMGVYLMNMSSNKADFWTALDVKLASVCAPDSVTYEATYTITSTLSPELAASLPFYQTGGWWGTEKYRTETYVLGPVGSSFLDSSVGVAALTNTVISVAPDLGRPVVRLAVEMPPGGTSTVTVRFLGAEAGGPLELKTTPLVIPTTSTITDGCG